MLRKKTSKSSKQLKDELVEAIDSIISDDDVKENDLSSNWIVVVDRGGLLHISDELYRVFVAMELVCGINQSVCEMKLPVYETNQCVE